jgi:hypothetical protein
VQPLAKFAADWWPGQAGIINKSLIRQLFLNGPVTSNTYLGSFTAIFVVTVEFRFTTGFFFPGATVNKSYLHYAANPIFE